MPTKKELTYAIKEIAKDIQEKERSLAVLKEGRDRLAQQLVEICEHKKVIMTDRKEDVGHRAMTKICFCIGCAKQEEFNLNNPIRTASVLSPKKAKEVPHSDWIEIRRKVRIKLGLDQRPFGTTALPDPTENK